MKTRSRRLAMAPALLATTLLGLLGGCATTPDDDNDPTVENQDSAPGIAQVRDGLGADIDSQELRTSLFANWDAFVDPEGRPVVYEWSVGTEPGKTDVLDWRQNAGAQRAAISDIDLPAGVTVHVNVRATDLAGNRSLVASSDGVVVGDTRLRTIGFRDDGSPAAPAGYLAGVDRHGVTWSFAKPARCGRYANGDWWVIGPIGIVAILPRSQNDGSRTRHGSMINPSPTELAQGYDSAMFGPDGRGRFDRKHNVALGIGRNRPLQLQPGSSLVSSISHPAAGELPQLESAAVLTCVAEPPARGAFRPPYCGSDKRSYWTTDELDLSRLAELPAAGNPPPVDSLLEQFERLWLDHLPGFTGRYLHPRQNMPDYGRDIASLVSTAALVLQTEIGKDDKRALAIALTQIGIDVFGIVANGGRFLADGGSGSGRKFPLVLAGALLDDQRMQRCAREQKLAFGEDAQTFYVAQAKDGSWNGGYGGYGPEDGGLADWGNRHADQPSLDRKAWTADPYRRCCTANVWHGFVLATRIMGLRDAWGHDALFDYVDRYMQTETRGHWMRGWDPFCERMWDEYRGEF